MKNKRKSASKDEKSVTEDEKVSQKMKNKRKSVSKDEKVSQKM